MRSSSPIDALELVDRRLGLVDALGALRPAELLELGAELGEVPAARSLLGQLAHRRDRHGVAQHAAVANGRPIGVEGEPALRLAGRDTRRDRRVRPPADSVGMTADSSSSGPA